ncbi:MAG TPA: exosortase B [Lysobacter sp.]|jgi:exosortase B|nr:exosortase B [Lysobacter sp.]
MSSMLGPSFAAREQSLSRTLLPVAFVAAGLVVMFAPVFVKLADTVWSTDEQGHGPIVLALVAWLLWQRRDRFAAASAQAEPAGLSGWCCLVFGLCLYALGRLQSIVMFEMGSMIPLITGALAVSFGWRVVRIAAFPIFFLLFAVPLPGPMVDMLTQPLKQGVSYFAEQIAYAAGYPISRSGVILMVGNYQLLVADACAGLNSMFALEALGLLYMNVIGHTSKLRNVLLAILIIPMSFTANVIRVMTLVLVTYHFGDEAGQGIVHGAAGMLLFAVALSLMFLLDSALGLFLRDGKS